MTKYNLTEKKERKAAYRENVRAELLDDLYEKILHAFVFGKKYRDCTYTAKKLAEELDTNTRYISAVVATRFENMNFSNLINSYRVGEAVRLLADKRFLKMNIAEIAQRVGFANRQSFYAAFYRIKGITPRQYRLKKMGSHSGE